jgi:hypothetical protein
LPGGGPSKPVRYLNLTRWYTFGHQREEAMPLDIVVRKREIAATDEAFVRSSRLGQARTAFANPAQGA